MNLASIWAVIKPDQQVDTVPVTSGIYADLDRDYHRFHGHSLVALHHFSSDWSTWEVHPHGDEIVVLLSGSVQMTLRHAHGERTTTLQQPGDFVVIPRNIWHTAQVAEPSQVLFVTPGEATANAAEPP